MYSDQQIQIAIEIYILEGLPLNAEDQLRELFLSNPKWFDYLFTRLNLVELQKTPPHTDKRFVV